MLQSSFQTKYLIFPLLTGALLLGACNQSSNTSDNAQPKQNQENATTSTAPYPYNDGKDHSWEAEDKEKMTAQALAAGDNFLSSQSWISATNSWGPIERNRSNGEMGSTDGRTITLNGVTYSNGFGVHANTQMTFDLNPGCTTFTSQIGLDDEVGSKGSAVFQVFADGTKLYDSGVMTGSSATKNVNVNISGRKTLKLVVTDAGDNNYFDHADWANAKVLGCSGTSGTSQVTYQGPLVITKGGTYTGNYQSTNYKTPAVLIQTKEPVVLENMNLRGPGNLIFGFGLNLTVRNTRGYGVNPNIYGKPTGRFIDAQEILNLKLENNYLEGTGGIYAYIFNGNSAAGQTIKILRNKIKNIDGRLSNGAGGYLNQRYYFQFVQFNRVRSVANVEIAWNEVINEPGQSSLEENINMYSSSGTAASPIKIHDNYLKGAYAIYPATDTNYSGGGILLGDGDASNMTVAPGYVDVYNNQIIDTSNQGVGIAGGHDHRVYNNRIVSSGRLSNGQPVAAQNVGIYLWDIANGSRYGTFFNNSFYNNTLGWTKVKSNGTSVLSNTWFANPCSSTACYNNASVGSVLSVSDVEQEYTRWQSKLANAGITVGPN